MATNDENETLLLRLSYVLLLCQRRSGRNTDGSPRAAERATRERPANQRASCSSVPSRAGLGRVAADEAGRTPFYVQRCGRGLALSSPQVCLQVAKIYSNSNYPRTMAELQATSVSQDAITVAQLELGGNPNAMALRRPFDPVAHDLDASFRLTRFADLKG